MKHQTELVLKDEGIREADLQKANEIIALLEQVTTIPVVGEFLKSKQLPFSAGSWEELKNERIIPELRNKKISIEELAKVLAESEEFGRCHVFLYQGKKSQVARLLERDHVERVCQRQNLTKALEEIVVKDLPAEPIITQIREEKEEGHQRRWVFKVIESRKERKFLEEIPLPDNVISKQYRVINMRAVNVARLHESGLLEIRIQSHLNTSQYRDDIGRIWPMLQEFLPPALFPEFSLRKAKDKIWGNREKLRNKVRFSDSRMTNTFGTTLQASTGGMSTDLFADSGATASIDEFLGHGAHCDSSNIWFRPQEGFLDRDIHVLISGMTNEFAVPGRCTRQEYEYVLNELRSHSR